MTDTKESQITVVARAPFHVYYEGPAYSVTATNSVGTFDILPGHADFFSMLSECTIIVETAESKVTFDVHNGMITVRNDEVMLFVNM
ncbi:hypothetical protein EOL96_00890 [Candidatus Saccharibacteria bacterium]|nr:hypothetical protein [Candidatus Saccharibacteria bacterium]